MPFVCCLVVVIAAVWGGIWLYNTLQQPRLSRTLLPGPPGGPQPGQIWQAKVPFEDGSGVKKRPCVVLGFTGEWYLVLTITSKDKGGRFDTVRIPTLHWDPTALHDSYLKVTPALGIFGADFLYHRGLVDPSTWAYVCRRHRF